MEKPLSKDFAGGAGGTIRSSITEIGTADPRSGLEEGREDATITYSELFRRHRVSLLALWLLPPATFVAEAFGHFWIQIMIPLFVFAGINAMIRLQKSGATRGATLTLCMIPTFVIWCVAVLLNVFVHVLLK